MGWYRNPSTDEWDSITTKAMTSAYRDALERAQTSGITVDKNGNSASDVLAKRIIALAKHGERDPQRLADGALMFLKR